MVLDGWSSMAQKYTYQSINQNFYWTSWHETNRLECMLIIENQKEQREEIKPLKDLDPAIKATLYMEEMTVIEM